MGRSEVLRWIFLPPPYTESVDAHRWRQASAFRAVVIGLCIAFNLLMWWRLPDNPVFDGRLVARVMPALVLYMVANLTMALLMYRFSWARRMWLMYTCVALEVVSNIVFIQGMGSLHSNAIVLSIGMVAFYRIYFGWRLGLWALLWAAIPHAGVVVLESAGLLPAMSWFSGEPLGQYTVPSMRYANLIVISCAYAVTLFGANAISNLLREKDRALAAARREAAKIADDVKHGRLSGTVLDGDLALGELLGRGGMGEIYAATRIGDNARIAVKVLHQYLANENTMLQRFSREARLASRLDGDCTAEILGVGYDPERDLHYIAMEYLRGEDLFSFLRRRDCLPVDRVIALGRAIGQVLDLAHRAGIVHRDLKPQNVFLLREGAEFEIRLLDFGIARLVDSLPGSTLTVAAEVIGTAGYMPPEQAVGDQEHIGPATDRFALAAILYRALTGELPFPAKRIGDYIHVVTTEPPRPASSVRADIPAALDAVFSKGLAKSPEDRFETSKALIDALEAAFLSSDRDVATGHQLAIAATMPGVA